MSLLRLQAVNIKAYDNSMPIRESSRKLWNQECFTLTFPKPPQPGRKKRSRPSELQITVPRYDKRKLEEVHNTAHTWIWHFLRKYFQRPSNYFTLRQQAPFRHPYTLKAHPEKLKDDNKKVTFKKNSKKTTCPHETSIESKETGNDKKPKLANKEDKTPSKSSHASELSKKSKYKSGTNPKSKDSQTVLMMHPQNSRAFKNSKVTDIEPICTKNDSKSSKNNSNAKSEACSKNNSNMNLMLYLEESGVESMEFDMWLKNYSQNNSKKPSKKESKKSSDAESTNSKDAKKDKKGARKGSKKKKNAKDTESTDAESGSELESKKSKKDSKKSMKASKKDDKKKDIKNEALSTDDDPESERISKKSEKDEKNNKKGLKKSDKKKSAMKSEEYSETESDWESKRDKKDSKKANRTSKKDSKRKTAIKNMDSTDVESDVSFKKDTKKPGISKSSDAESEESMFKAGSKKKGVYESDAISTDSKKEAMERNKGFKKPFRRTTFKERGKSTVTGRVPPSRESSLPYPCEPLQLSPKINHLCRCKLDPPQPKPRYAPLPEAKWIHKLL